MTIVSTLESVPADGGAHRSLLRNGRAIALSSSLTSALGVLYWILAARTYSPAVLGTNATAVSAMMFVGGLASLNLPNALIRIIPCGGMQLRRIVGASYAVVLVVGVVASVIFVAGLRIWAPALLPMASRSWLYVAFGIATAAWCAFLLQDGALAGMRRAVWIPVENGVFAVAKIVFLVALVKRFPISGVFLSWALALIVSVVPTTIGIFARGIPGPKESVVTSPPVDLMRYVGADYAASLCWMAATLLVPLFILNIVGTSANASFSLAWSMAYALYLVSVGMGQSLVAEAAANPTKTGSLCRQAWLHTMRLTLPLAVLMVVGAPLILQVFGSHYRQTATPVLRLLALSAVPNVATALAVSVARARQQMLRVFTIVAGISALVLLLTWLLVKPLGIVGVGWAWLVAQSAVGVVAYRRHLRPLWLAEEPAPVPLWLAQVHAVLASAPLLVGRGRLRVSSTSPDISALTERIMADAGLVGAGVAIATVSDLAIIEVHHHQVGRSFIKIARTEAAARVLARQGAILAALRAEPNLPSAWHRLLPVATNHGVQDGRDFVIERALPGTPGVRQLHNPVRADALILAAMKAISPLHQATGRREHIGRSLMVSLVEDPLARLEDLVPVLHSGSHRRAIVATRQACLDGLQDRIAWRCWTHGDYWAGNILADADHGVVSGILDWDGAIPHGLATLDIVHYLLTTRMATSKAPLGQCVLQLLAGAPLSQTESDVLCVARELDGTQAPALDTMVRLAWLSHVVNNVEKSHRYRTHRLWVHANIEAVLSWHLR